MKQKSSPASGWTLLELLVVLALVGIAVSSVQMAMPTSAQTGLERDAKRLAAKLQAQRIAARAQGQARYWLAQEQGFSWALATPRTGAWAVDRQESWESRETRMATGFENAKLRLGPDPVLPAQFVLLTVTGAPSNAATWWVGTDGVSSFTAKPAP